MTRIRTHEEKRKPLTQKQRDRMLSGQNYRCAIPACRAPIGGTHRFEDDHWLARIDGGSEDLSNRRLICIPCHRAKSKREHVGNAKAKRLRFGKSRKGPPMDGSRDSRFKKHMDGSVSFRERETQCR